MSQLEESKLFLPVPELTLADLLDWQDPSQRDHRHIVHKMANELRVTRSDEMPSGHKKCFGNAVQLNDEAIALFRIGSQVYATQARCPHAGGPLYLADIEELVTGQLSLRCPWHKWTFDIDTGKIILPKGQRMIAKTYPVRVDVDGHIAIGFDAFGPSAFRLSF